MSYELKSLCTDFYLNISFSADLNHTNEFCDIKNIRMQIFFHESSKELRYGNVKTDYCNENGEKYAFAAITKKRIDSYSFLFDISLV